MAEVTLVTGGVRSGKSSYAERQVRDAGEAVVYLATGVATDEEMVERIAHHQATRPSTWITWEGFRNIEHAVDNAPDANAVLLDCIGNLLTGIWYEELPDDDSDDLDAFSRIEQATIAELDAIVRVCRETNRTLVMVTNEVGMGVVPPTKLGRYFRDALGRVNAHAAALSDHVTLLVCGIPLTLK
jgi:adenosylcobinamide kinase/adenosylcobinamide-phosphate guanylyltransferase